MTHSDNIISIVSPEFETAGVFPRVSGRSGRRPDCQTIRKRDWGSDQRFNTLDLVGAERLWRNIWASEH